MRRHRYPLRKGKTPTAKELEREMANPNQLRLHAVGWGQVSHPIQVSADVVFSLAAWSQRTATLAEQMVALGSSQEEAARVALEMNEEILTEIQKIRDTIEKPKNKVKIGRNDQCPCGGGKKYKNCCLK